MGGSTGAIVLTVLGLVIVGGSIAAIGFGIGTMGGTATGAITGNKLLEKVIYNEGNPLIMNGFFFYNTWN